MSQSAHPIMASLNGVADDVNQFLTSISVESYTRKLAILSNATVGQHTRHFIEFFQCLYNQVNSTGECVDYGKRKRDIRIEVDPECAVDAFNLVIRNITEQEAYWDRSVALRPESDHLDNIVQTTYAREIIYGIEHCIHHLAIIKIGLLHMDPATILPDNFGIAPSTIKHRTRTCAQ